MFLILITTTTAGITDQAVVVMSCLAAAAAVVSHQLHSEYLSPSGLCHTLGLWPFSWTTTPSSKWVFNSSLLLRVVCLFEFTLGFLTSAVCVSTVCCSHLVGSLRVSPPRVRLPDLQGLKDMEHPETSVSKLSETEFS